MAPTRTHYDVLGIDSDADAAAVKAAWKVLIQVWHPDRFSGDMREHAESQTARINESYHVLRDEERRATYDRRLEYEAGETERATTSARGPFGSARPAASSATRSPFPQSQGMPGGAVAMSAPKPVMDTASEFGASLIAAARANPRIVIAAVAVWVLLVGGSMVHSALTRPHLPSDVASSTSVSRAVSTDTGPDPIKAFDAAAADAQALADAGSTAGVGTPDAGAGAGQADAQSAVPDNGAAGGVPVQPQYATPDVPAEPEAPAPTPVPRGKRVIRVLPQPAG